MRYAQKIEVLLKGTNIMFERAEEMYRTIVDLAELKNEWIS
jgi:hypothetical protein